MHVINFDLVVVQALYAAVASEEQVLSALAGGQTSSPELAAEIAAMTIELLGVEVRSLNFAIYDVERFSEVDVLRLRQILRELEKRRGRAAVRPGLRREPIGSPSYDTLQELITLRKPGSLSDRLSKARKARKVRWANAKPEQRSAHAKKMVEVREAKKRVAQESEAPSSVAFDLNSQGGEA